MLCPGLLLFQCKPFGVGVEGPVFSLYCKPQYLCEHPMTLQDLSSFLLQLACLCQEICGRKRKVTFLGLIFTKIFGWPKGQSAQGIVGSSQDPGYLQPFPLKHCEGVAAKQHESSWSLVKRPSSLRAAFVFQLNWQLETHTYTHTHNQSEGLVLKQESVLFAIITIIFPNLALHCHSKGCWVFLSGKLSVV